MRSTKIDGVVRDWNDNEHSCFLVNIYVNILLLNYINLYWIVCFYAVNFNNFTKPQMKFYILLIMIYL